MGEVVYNSKTGKGTFIHHDVDVRELLQTGQYVLTDPKGPSPAEEQKEEAPVEEKKEEAPVEEKKEETPKIKTGIDSLPSEPEKKPEKKLEPANLNAVRKPKDSSKK